LQHALKLGDAAEIYEQAEQENAQSGSSMVEGASGLMLPWLTPLLNARWHQRPEGDETKTFTTQSG
jgi:hypothetical protein